MSLAPIFLSVDDVLELHRRGINEHGGDSGVRDLALLESAVATPQAGFGGEYAHPTLWLMAAAYAFHIAENQPFVDGNKRAAIAAALYFLALNGFSFDARANAPLYDAMIGLSSRALDKAGLARLFEALALNASPTPG